MGSWSSGPPSATNQRSPAPAAAAAAAAISGAGTATCAPAAPGPSANEIVARTIAQVENLLDKTLAPLAERLSSIEATQREGGGGGGGPPDPTPPNGDVESQATSYTPEGSSYDGSSYSPGIPGPDEYVQLTRENHHYCARALRDDPDQRPRRCDLFGNKTWASLSDGKRGSGGTLGFSFEYSEPIAAFLCQANLFLQDVIAGLDDGSTTEQDLRYQLTVLGNSTREIYALSNEHRALLELKAKALSGDDYDKQCTKHVERTFHVRDYASPDLPADIAELQDEFATDTHREQRRTAAKMAAKGGQPSGGGKPRSERSRGGKPRSERSTRDRPKDKPFGRRGNSSSPRRDRRGKDESDGEQHRGRDRGGQKERRSSPARDKPPSASQKPKSTERRSHSGGKGDDRDRRGGGKGRGSSGSGAAGKAAGGKPARRGRDSSRSESGSGSD